MIANNIATSQPSPRGAVSVGGAIVFCLPRIRLGSVYPVGSSLRTPPWMDDATVFTVPLAICIGAVEYEMEEVVEELYALVEWNSTEAGALATPPVEKE